MSGWRDAGRAGLILLLALLLMFGVARFFAMIDWLPLYRNQFVFTPGDWFAWRLNTAQSDHDRACALLGASSVREGFDPSLVAKASGIPTYNLGATGGHSAIDVIEIQATILAARGQRYACIVIGLHPIFLRKFVPDAYDLIVTDYVAPLPLDGLLAMSRPFFTLPHADQVVIKYLMPMAQHSLVLSRLLRLGLLDLHRALIAPSASVRRYELYDGEFTPQSEFAYRSPSVLAEIGESYSKQIAAIGWDKAENYGGADEARALHAALRNLAGVTDRLVVVEMPESYLFDDADAVAAKAFEAALSTASVPFAHIRCVVPRAEQETLFHDAVHLSETGRAELSASIGALLAGLPEAPPGLCTALDTGS